MTDQALHIAMCVDNEFALPLAVTLASIDAIPEADVVTVHILNPGFSASVRERIAAGVKRATLSWIRVDETQLNGAHFTSSLSLAALYRLLLDELLPPDVDRVLYLDADTVVEDSLREVFDTDLGGAVLAAVRDANTPWAASMNGSPWRLLGLEPSALYFNSGVMLIDRLAWRRAAVGEQCIELLRKEQLRWGDQDALNGVVRDRWVELGLRWNVQTCEYRGDCAGWALWPAEVEAAVERPGVIHYTETQKPWHFGSDHAAAGRWYGWLDKTAWASWLPSQPRDVPGVRLARTLVRSLRSLNSNLRQRRALPNGLV